MNVSRLPSFSFVLGLVAPLSATITVVDSGQSIIYSEPSVNAVSLDYDGNGQVDTQLVWIPGLNEGIDPEKTTITRLSQGDLVDATTTVTSDKFPIIAAGLNPNAPYTIGQNYVGLAFPRGVDENEKTHYGWMELDLQNTAFTIIRWAWESEPDTPITVGQVPEPRFYAALTGLLALGFVAWPRRR